MSLHEPYSDNILANLKVLHQGTTRWLKAALMLEGTTTVVPPDDDWTDVADIVRILDPDGNPVDLSEWRTTTPITGHEDEDDFDANHPDHIGGDWLGLFHNGDGRFAQKVEVPVLAEVTSGVEGKEWTVEWRLKRRTKVIESSEKFNVDKVAFIAFDGSQVTVGNLRSRVKTVLTDGELMGIINDSVEWAKGYLEDEQTEFKSVRGSVREAIIKYAVSIVTLHDLSAHRRMTGMTEGDVSFRFHGLGGHQPVIDFHVGQAEKDLQRYIRRHGRARRPRLGVTRAKPAGLKGVDHHGDF